MGDSIYTTRSELDNMFNSMFGQPKNKLTRIVAFSYNLRLLPENKVIVLEITCVIPDEFIKLVSVMDMYYDNIPIDDMVNYGICSKSNIYRIIKKLKLPKRKKENIKRLNFTQNYSLLPETITVKNTTSSIVEQHRNIITLYVCGFSIDQIAKSVDLEETYIQEFLRDRKIKIKKEGELLEKNVTFNCKIVDI